MSTVPANNLASSSAQHPADTANGKNERWAARFGQVIAQRGVATIPQALFYYQGQLGLSAQEVWLVCCLLADKWDGDLPRSSLHMLAKDSGLSVRQIQRIRGSLEAKTYLLVVESFADKLGQLSNCYDLAGLFKELELLIATEPTTANEIQAEDAPPYLRSLSGDWSFVERYGRVLIQRGIATIPQALFIYQAALHLTPQQVWFCCYVLAHKWDTEYPYPSLTKMAERTGYKRTTIQDIKNELVARSLLSLVRRSNPAGGQDSNGYDFSGLLAALSQLIQHTAPALAASEQPMTCPGSCNSARGRGRRSVAALAVTTSEIAEGGMSSTRQGGMSSTRQGGMSPAQQTRMSSTRHEEESDQEESDQEDSNRTAANLETKGTRLTSYSNYISRVIFDYSTELGDPTHTASNISQAMNLWQESGLAEEEFVARLYEARKLTRSYQNKQGSGFIGNKMAYFYAVVRDLMLASATATAVAGGSR